MKVKYPIRYHKDVDPPPRRVGLIPRWKAVTDELENLVREGGVIFIQVPEEHIKREIKSLRNAVYREKSRRGIKGSFSIQIADNGINVWSRGGGRP